ncbi:MAG: hypothetical protein IMY76_01920 [Chloroflexi bacterium]|nr:hypothetical protein [Chloroflexota bacterium]
MTQNKRKRIIWLFVLMLTSIILSGCTIPSSLNPFFNKVISSENPLAPISELAVSASPTLIPTRLQQTLTPTYTTAIAASNVSFSDNTYRLALEYPSSWSLYILPAGRQTGSGFAAKTLQFVNGDTKLVIQYNFLWENTVFGGNIPPGNLEVQGLVSLLGHEIPKHVIVDDDTDRYVFFGDSFEDLAFHIRIETILSNPTDYNAANIPDDLQTEAAEIVATILRTGQPLPSPTPTPLPTITPIPTLPSSSSGSSGPQTGPPVKLGACYQAEYISSITAGNGTTIAPGAQFTKIWRIKNAGNCVWSTGFNLVLAKGDPLDKTESIAIPENILPGETVDIEGDFTAPETLGNYSSSWFIHDSYGNWFGFGEDQSGYIPLKINVAEPVPPHAYDFALHYCDATWKNSTHEEDQEAPCPGSSTSETGFVILLNDPHLEIRNENELALWIHPLEERNGWFKGTYPAFDVQAGDRFKAWIGCLSDNPKCSLIFYLDYIDNAGIVHNLGQWPESIDGEITLIDLDLSVLAGQTVQFVLKTEANTLNVETAQGFWFVPHIQR